MSIQKVTLLFLLKKRQQINFPKQSKALKHVLYQVDLIFRFAKWQLIKYLIWETEKWLGYASCYLCVSSSTFHNPYICFCLIFIWSFIASLFLRNDSVEVLYETATHLYLICMVLHQFLFKSKAASRKKLVPTSKVKLFDFIGRLLKLLNLLCSYVTI